MNAGTDGEAPEEPLESRNQERSSGGTGRRRKGEPGPGTEGGKVRPSHKYFEGERDKGSEQPRSSSPLDLPQLIQPLSCTSTPPSHLGLRRPPSGHSPRGPHPTRFRALLHGAEWTRVANRGPGPVAVTCPAAGLDADAVIVAPRREPKSPASHTLRPTALPSASVIIVHVVQEPERRHGPNPRAPHAPPHRRPAGQRRARAEEPFPVRAKYCEGL